MQFLIYFGKHGNEYWLADTPERLEAALRKLFTRLDEWGCYESGNLGEPDWLDKARAGDLKSIRWLLEVRQDYEYERWELEEAVDPCTG